MRKETRLLAAACVTHAIAVGIANYLNIFTVYQSRTKYLNNILASEAKIASEPRFYSNDCKSIVNSFLYQSIKEEKPQICEPGVIWSLLVF